MPENQENNKLWELISVLNQLNEDDNLNEACLHILTLSKDAFFGFGYINNPIWDGDTRENLKDILAWCAQHNIQENIEQLYIIKTVVYIHLVKEKAIGDNEKNKAINDLVALYRTIDKSDILDSFFSLQKIDLFLLALTNPAWPSIRVVLTTFALCLLLPSFIVMYKPLQGEKPSCENIHYAADTFFVEMFVLLAIRLFYRTCLEKCTGRVNSGFFGGGASYSNQQIGFFNQPLVPLSNPTDARDLYLVAPARIEEITECSQNNQNSA